MYDDTVRRRVFIPYYAVPRNWFATFGHDELRFACRCRFFGFRLVRFRIFGIVALLVLLFVDKKRPEFEYLAGGIDFQDLVQVFQIDDPRPDFAVKLLFVVGFVNRDDFAQHTTAERGIELLHSLLEHLHAPFDVVLPLAFEKTLDRLLSFGRGDDIEPFGFGACVVGGDDFDLVAAVDLRGDRFDLVVDLGADGAVADFRVYVVREVQRSGSVRHFSSFSFGCKYCYFRCV